MKTTEGRAGTTAVSTARGLAAPLLAAGAGFVLWALLSFLDREAKALALLLVPSMAETATLLAPVLVEEAAKFLTIISFISIAPRARRILPGSPSGAGLGIVAIIIFSAFENLAYLRAFPGSDVFQRLLWSEPVHLVTALAYAVALSGSPVSAEGPATATKRGLRSVPAAVLALLFGLVWHFAANSIADSGPGSFTVAAVSLVNFTMIIALSLLYFDRAMSVVRTARSPGATRKPGGSPHE